MRTVILDPLPPEIEALIERRRRLGLDTHDEVWEGEYHMVPGPHPHHGAVAMSIAVTLAGHAAAAGLVGTTEFNVGDGLDDFRVPDLGYHRGTPHELWVHTAAVVVEVLSPHDGPTPSLLLRPP